MSSTLPKSKPPAPPFIKKLLTPFEEFTSTAALSGSLLGLAAILALVMANSPFAHLYTNLLHLQMAFSVGTVEVNTTLHHFVNEALMTIFFFVVGLEIKRELLTGELSSLQKAMLPVAAAIGGMVFPALIYTAFNWGQVSQSGWAIPMATDIAFALGVLALLGSRVPPAAKVFLTALAILDDLAAILVIAAFYSHDLAVVNVLAAICLVLFLLILNRSGVSRAWPYVATGIVVWLLLLESGIHATIAGVVVAATIPAFPKLDTEKFYKLSAVKLEQFKDAALQPKQGQMLQEQEAAIHELSTAIKQVRSPLSSLEDALHPWSTLAIMPLFAFFNSGITLTHSMLAFNSISAGIAAGLLIGKPVGVLLASYLAIRTGAASLPRDLTGWHMIGLAILTGIGFTMSIFIANLAFANSSAVNTATASILIASFTAICLGYIVLRFSASSNKRSADLDGSA